MSRRYLSSISWFHKNNRSRRHQTEISLLRNPSKILESFLTRAVVMLLLFALEKSTISLSTFWVFTPDTCVVSLTHSFNCRVRRIASLALVWMVCIQFVWSMRSSHYVPLHVVRGTWRDEWTFKELFQESCVDYCIHACKLLFISNAFHASLFDLIIRIYFRYAIRISLTNLKSYMRRITRYAVNMFIQMTLFHATCVHQNI